jgi:glycosidase
LVKLNLECAAVREYLFDACKFWIKEFDIDGLRLDAANVISPDFLSELSVHCKAIKNGFWLAGETVAGDYRELACEGRLDSVTNYELYKSLWSSFNDKNFFEIAWTLKRQFAEGGIYPHLGLYNFADNHDVNRVASIIKNSAHLFPLYGLLFCASGIPSIYYGSEYALRGERDEYSDRVLRPAWNETWEHENAGTMLFQAISNFARIRRNSSAIIRGSYRELLVTAEQFVFLREDADERVIVVVNAADKQTEVHIRQQILNLPKSRWFDLLSGENFYGDDDGLRVGVASSWLRILHCASVGA